MRVSRRFLACHDPGGDCLERCGPITNLEGTSPNQELWPRQAGPGRGGLATSNLETYRGGGAGEAAWYSDPLSSPAGKIPSIGAEPTRIGPRAPALPNRERPEVCSVDSESIPTGRRS